MPVTVRMPGAKWTPLDFSNAGVVMLQGMIWVVGIMLCWMEHMSEDVGVVLEIFILGLIQHLSDKIIFVDAPHACAL